MRPLIVVDRPENWPLDIAEVEVVSARRYLAEAERYARLRVKVCNLCRSYRYQSTGYYVSLLATARGHRPMPSVTTIQDLKASEIVKILSSDLEELVDKSLAPIKSKSFVLSIYFGRNVARRHDRLAAKIFALFEAPLLRATFRQSTESLWELAGVKALAAEDIPPEHHDFVLEVAREYFAKSHRRPPAPRRGRYDMAILFDEQEEEPPSDERAISKFIKAARAEGIDAEVIGKTDYPRLAEYDALFIRETTNVNHHTYRFARRAASEGMVVIDDPESILRCTNKVYLAELLGRHGIPAPETMVLHKGNLEQAIERLGLPCVLKQPDSSFSQGVKKVATAAELAEEGERMLSTSELIIGQTFTPTEFDWRVGVLDGVPMWVCRYFMVQKHWQIAKTGRGGGRRYGRTECVPIDEAPAAVIKTALRATRLIGEGLYGVDLKEIGRRVVVIEINDNPSIEAGYEDGAGGDELYRRIMQVFVKRLDAKHNGTHEGAASPV